VTEERVCTTEHLADLLHNRIDRHSFSIGAPAPWYRRKLWIGMPTNRTRGRWAADYRTGVLNPGLAFRIAAAFGLAVARDAGFGAETNRRESSWFISTNAGAVDPRTWGLAEAVGVAVGLTIASLAGPG
jgi:hypothetical protein